MLKFHKLKVDKIKQITDESVEIFFEVPQNLKSNFLFNALYSACGLPFKEVTPELITLLFFTIIQPTDGFVLVLPK